MGNSPASTGEIAVRRESYYRFKPYWHDKYKTMPRHPFEPETVLLDVTYDNERGRRNVERKDMDTARELSGISAELERMSTSAWDGLHPSRRSQNVGWSTSGEFECPYCGTSIGKNLKGESPHALAREHLEEEHGKTWADVQKEFKMTKASAFVANELRAIAAGLERMDRTASSIEELKRALSGIGIVDGDTVDGGYVMTKPDEDVWVAIVAQPLGNAGAQGVIVVDDNSYHMGKGDRAVEKAGEILQEWNMEHYGEEDPNIDLAGVWKVKTKQLAEAIKGTAASKYLEFE